MKKISISIALCSLLGGGVNVLSAQEVQVLDDAVVSASGFAQEIKEAPATINVITKEELKKKPYRDVAEAIADVPGVDIFADKDKAGNFKITMRGMRGYTLILIDGRRQGVGGDVGPNSFEGIQNAFLPPISAIERIEVIKGPMSTLYGSEALGGVVNIITKKVGDEWGVSVTTEGMFQNDSQWGNLYGVSVYGSGPLIKDKLGLTLRAREFYREESNVKFEANGKEVTESMNGNPGKSNMHNFGAKLSYLLDENNTLIYDFDYSQNVYDNSKMENGGSRFGNLTKIDGDYVLGGYTDEMTMDKIVTYFSHQGTYDNFTLDSGVQYNRITNDGREVVGKKTKPHAGENRDIQSEDIIVDTKAVIPILDWNMLSIGAEYRFQKMTDKILQPSNFDQYLLGIFAEDEISILDNLNLTLGARYNKHEYFGNNISPRGYLVWNATDELTLKGGVATGFKAPFANELIPDTFNFGSQGRLPFYGNPDLKEETSINYELGTIYQADKFYIGLTGFVTDFKDKLELVDIKQNSQIPHVGKCEYEKGCMQQVNVGKVRYMGIELAAGVTPVENLNLDLSYTYLDSEIKEIREKDKAKIGKPLEGDLEHNLILKASYKVADFTPWIRGQWQGNRYAGKTWNDYPTQKESEYIEESMEYYDDVFLIDIGMGYEINENWNLNFAIKNLFDHKFTDEFIPYISYDSRNKKFDTKAYQNKNYNTEEGRRFWVSLTGSF